MHDKDKRGSRIIGGMTLIGIGVGFILFRTSPFLFVASVLIGIGVGLLIASALSGNKGEDEN
jgi:F0F1-type ATP synthase assembly protein I